VDTFTLPKRQKYTPAIQANTRANLGQSKISNRK
jgi:hypothetical protein